MRQADLSASVILAGRGSARSSCEPIGNRFRYISTFRVKRNTRVAAVAIVLASTYVYAFPSEGEKLLLLKGEFEGG